jgi:hypothetical protein
MNSAQAQWNRLNGDFLAAAVALLRFQLEQFAQRLSGTPANDSVIADRKGLELALMNASTAKPKPAFLILADRFGLSAFEQNILMLCAAMELDTRIATLCAAAQNNPNRPFPTFALAMALFNDPSWDAVSPHRPLRAFRMVDVVQNGMTPFTQAPLRADERIVGFIVGIDEIDERFRPYLVPFDTPVTAESSVSESQRFTVERIITEIRDTLLTNRRMVVQLTGTDRFSKELTTVETCRRIGLNIARIHDEVIPTHMAEFDSFVMLWNRESLLQPIALFIDAHEMDSPRYAEPSIGQQTSPLLRFLQRNQGIVFISVRDALPDQGFSATLHDIGKPTEQEQAIAWKSAFDKNGFNGTMSYAEFASQFNMNIPTISNIVKRESASGFEKSKSRVWTAALLSSRPRLDQLAERIKTNHSWDDLALPREQRDQLLRMTAHVQYRSRVFSDWGFASAMNRGTGLNALFTGPSGTGKTFAAGIMAKTLNIALYRIDLSSVVSKYIGETEKNLKRVFDAAEDGGAILFFDEADALFGRRSEVKDSHDRYANIEINYLLQRMESYTGCAILATNAKNLLDKAFMRRLRFIVHFPFPSFVEREKIWRRIFPSKTPLENLDWQRLAQLNVSGGSISNIALNAAFMAAANGGRVSMAMIFEAAKAELHKLDHPVHDTFFRYEETGSLAKKESVE